MNITWIGSPNFDNARKPIDRIIIHWIVGTLASADAQFQKPKGTSAHYGIEDIVIHQYVQESDVAYHAGVYAMNQRSIGIEHSASPDRPASEQTYKTSGQLVARICKDYNIPLDRTHILKHSEVKATQCCGTVDVDKIIEIAKTFSQEMVTIAQSELDQIRLDRDTHWNNYTASQQELELVKKINAELNIDYDGVKQELNSYKGILQTFATLLGTKVTETEKMAGEITRLNGTQDLYNSVSKTNENLMNEVAELQNEKGTLTTANQDLLQEKKDLTTALEYCRLKTQYKTLKEYSVLERLLSLFS